MTENELYYDVDIELGVEKGLRPFDENLAKEGYAIQRYCGEPVKYLHGPDVTGMVATLDSRDWLRLHPTGHLAMVPLGYCEGKAVYTGDVLYSKEGVSRSDAGDTFEGYTWQESPFGELTRPGSMNLWQEQLKGKSFSPGNKGYKGFENLIIISLSALVLFALAVWV